MTDDIDKERRKFLKVACGVMVGAGLVGAGVPLIKSWLPSESTEADNAPITVDISQLQANQQITVQWRGQPIWVIRRTPDEIAELKKVNSKLRDPSSKTDQQPQNARNDYRSLRPDIFVAVGICTHLGCIPNFFPQPGSIDAAWDGGFLCPCHGSRYDLAGRVYKDMPAPLNLLIPPYHFVDEHTLVIGE